MVKIFRCIRQFAAKFLIKECSSSTKCGWVNLMICLRYSQSNYENSYYCNSEVRSEYNIKWIKRG